MTDRGVRADIPAARAASDPTGSNGRGPICGCGHVEAAHRHYRRGSDCGVCGAATCARFRRQPPIRLGARLRAAFRRDRG